MKKIITFLSSFLLIISLNVNADEASAGIEVNDDAYKDKMLQSLADYSTILKLGGSDNSLIADARLVATVDTINFLLLDVLLNDDGSVNSNYEHLSYEESGVFNTVQKTLSLANNEYQIGMLYDIAQGLHKALKVFDPNGSSVGAIFLPSLVDVDSCDDDDCDLGSRRAKFDEISEGFYMGISTTWNSKRNGASYHTASQNILAVKAFAAAFSSLLMPKPTVCVPHSGGSCAAPI